MHAIGVCLGLIGMTIVVTAVNIERIEIAPILAYVIGLVTNSRSRLLTTYVSPAKWVLRRFDHFRDAGLGSRALAYLQLVSRTCR